MLISHKAKLYLSSGLEWCLSCIIQKEANRKPCLSQSPNAITGPGDDMHNHAILFARGCSSAAMVLEFCPSTLRSRH